MDCGKCRKVVNEKDVIKCMACNLYQHYYCADLSEIEFKKILPMNKLKWKCSICKSKKIGISGTISPKVQGFSSSMLNVDTQAFTEYFDAKFDSLRQQWREDLHIAIQDVSISLKQDIEKLEKRLVASEGRIMELEHTLASYESRPEYIEENTTLRADLNVLQSKFDDLDQASRSCNVEIQNIPEKKSENLIHLCVQIGKLIDVDIKECDIRSVHRVTPGPGVRSDRPRNIVLQLCTRRQRDEVIASARARRSLTTAQLLGGAPTTAAAATQNTRFYINEHLTLKNKILFSKARQQAKLNKYKFTWIKNGCILLRKNDDSRVIQIRCENDLSKI